MTQVFVCLDANFDSTTGQCSAGTWVDQSQVTVFPPLSLQDGQDIAFGIALAWVCGWAWRQIGKALDA